MKQTNLICHKCKKQAKTLHGSMNGNFMECDDCYIPFEKRDNFEYIPTGKTSGIIKTPHELCGICGKTITRPTPLELWIHKDEFNDESFNDDEDHLPRIANVLELLVMRNNYENRINSSANTNVYYYHLDSKEVDCASNKKHIECAIHRKYWLVELGYNGKSNCCKLSDYGKWNMFIDTSINRAERINAKSFTKFLKSSEKHLMKNPRITKYRNSN